MAKQTKPKFKTLLIDDLHAQVKSFSMLEELEKTMTADSTVTINNAALTQLKDFAKVSFFPWDCSDVVCFQNGVLSTLTDGAQVNPEEAKTFYRELVITLIDAMDADGLQQAYLTLNKKPAAPKETSKALKEIVHREIVTAVSAGKLPAIRTVQQDKPLRDLYDFEVEIVPAEAGRSDREKALRAMKGFCYAIGLNWPNDQRLKSWSKKPAVERVQLNNLLDQLKKAFPPEPTTSTDAE